MSDPQVALQHRRAAYGVVRRERDRLARRNEELVAALKDACNVIDGTHWAGYRGKYDKATDTSAWDHLLAEEKAE
jgi:hypothetical protein